MWKILKKNSEKNSEKKKKKKKKRRRKKKKKKKKRRKKRKEKESKGEIFSGLPWAFFKVTERTSPANRTSASVLLTAAPFF